MNRRVLFGRKSYEVLGRVIRLVAVDVVDVLIRAKSAAVGLFPHKAMLGHIATLVRQVMAGHPEHPVPVTILGSPTFPCVGAVGESPRLLVSSDKTDRVAFVMAAPGIRSLRSLCLAATTTLAEPARDFAGWLKRAQFANRGESSSPNVMADDESRWPVLVVLFPNDRLFAPAIASVHGDSISVAPPLGNFAVAVGIQ